MNDNIVSLIKQIKSAGLASESDVKGCSEAEVQLLEARYGRVFPSAYRDFLLGLGQNAGVFMMGTQLFYKDMELLLGCDISDVLAETSPQRLVFKSIHIFGSHQGYVYMFFDVNDASDDPVVYTHTEGDAESVCQGPFTRFMRECLEEQIHLTTRGPIAKAK